MLQNKLGVLVSHRQSVSADQSHQNEGDQVGVQVDQVNPPEEPCEYLRQNTQSINFKNTPSIQSVREQYCQS